MAGVVFNHPNPALGQLTLRLPPTNVEWSYRLVTNVQPTYAGEVVQLLGIRFERFVIEGQFGKEGPHGGSTNPGTFDVWKNKDPINIGLTQLTKYFRDYFSIASQGVGDKSPATNYDERPMTIRYEGASPVSVDTDKQESEWKVYPVSFPSYSRSNEEFAPKWRVECEVAEAPTGIQHGEFSAALKRLRSAVGYTAYNPYSDPFANLVKPNKNQQLTSDQQKKAFDTALSTINSYLDHYTTLIGDPTAEELNELIFAGASIPRVYGDLLEKQAGTNG